MKIYVVHSHDYDQGEVYGAFSDERDAYAYLQEHETYGREFAISTCEVDAQQVERDPEHELGPVYYASVHLTKVDATAAGGLHTERRLRHPTQGTISVSNDRLQALSPLSTEDAALMAKQAVEAWRADNPQSVAEAWVDPMRCLNLAIKTLFDSTCEIEIVEPIKDELLTGSWKTTIKSPKGVISVSWKYGHWFTIDMGSKGIAYASPNSTMSMIHTFMQLGPEALR